MFSRTHFFFNYTVVLVLLVAHFTIRLSLLHMWATLVLLFQRIMLLL